MRNLLARVKRLEEAAARARVEEAARVAALRLPIEEVDARLRREVAVSKLFDSLEASYPADPLNVAGLPRLSSSQKVREAALRLAAGLPTDADRHALAALPGDALRAFGHSAKDFLAAVGLLHSRPEPDPPADSDRRRKTLAA
ncbi:MAG: hypothetical protein KIT35_09385 [Piscinibacter sp.]|uniref:hypothetical protein n=1 Tax=Piscinibacter sp. TaxID=1903157 RepID=UPI0025898815|nr:hypothetical protein [Piscinibacter sp.]MCW5664034.1 hypothetical protein [Piscinibacter sp.]